MMNLLEQLELLGAADRKCMTAEKVQLSEEQLPKNPQPEEQQPAAQQSVELYLLEIKAFLEGQDFLRLGHCISGSNWNGVMMNVRRMRENCKKLGMTCFDRWLMGIRDCAQRRNREEAVQIMTQITAKRVQLRKLFTEGK